MEMRILSELSLWLMSESGLVVRWGSPLWQEAFDACGSPSEWKEFCSARRDAPSLKELWNKYDALGVQITREYSTRAPHRHVQLPDF